MSYLATCAWSDLELARVSSTPICVEFVANLAGAPARNQIAIAASKSMQPHEDVGINGHSGLPHSESRRTFRLMI